MTVYHIQTQKAERRGSIEHGTQATMTWISQPYWGEHSTPVAAMRRYIEEVDPSTKGMPDDWMRRQWRAWARSQGLRTVRSPLPSPDPTTAP